MPSPTTVQAVGILLKHPEPCWYCSFWVNSLTLQLILLCLLGAINLICCPTKVTISWRRFWSLFGYGAFFFFLPSAYGNSRLGVGSELQLPAYTIATATPDLSRIYNLHHSSRQCWIPQHAEWGQGLNLHPHGYYSDSFLLSHNGNALVMVLN